MYFCVIDGRLDNSNFVSMEPRGTSNSNIPAGRWTNMSNQNGAVASQSIRDGSGGRKICRFFQRGMCHFDDLCRNAHILHPDQPNPRTSIMDTPKYVSGENVNTPSTRHTVKDSHRLNRYSSQQYVAPQKFDVRSTKKPISSLSACSSSSTSYNSLENAQRNADSKLYSQVLFENGQQLEESGACGGVSDEFCPNNADCPYKQTCYYIHLELCDMCGRYCLHPSDREQRKKHNVECIRQHEKNMELSFAVARSKDKQCGICFDVIMEKSGSEQRFGILLNCNHIYCLQCIRKWRQSRNFENKIIRACPECRIPSDFVCPSAFWVETKEDKEKLINDYKSALQKKDCKYFKKGNGECPFGNKCFYKHALSNGTIIDVGLPRRSRRVHRDNPELTESIVTMYLYDFLEGRNDDLMFFDSSDNGDSDFSEIIL